MSKRALNKDDKLRHEIMGIVPDYLFDLRNYDKVSLETLDNLIENNFVDLACKFNYSPAINDYRDFMERHKNERVFLHGFITSIERDDYGFYVEGLVGYSNDKAFIIEFANLFHNADEFECSDGYQRCWYD